MSSERLQSYMKSHKIGGVFEEMMAKLAKNMPLDPYEYLINILHEKRAAQKKDDKQIDPSIWTSKDAERDDKPWRTGSKKTGAAKKRTASPHKSLRSSLKADDLKNLSSLKKSTPKKWVESDDNSSTRVQGKITADEDLSDELPLVKTEVEEKTELVDVFENRSSRKSKPAQDAKNHRKALQEFIEQKKKEQKKVNEKRDIMDDSSAADSGIEIYENPDDLINEGVKVERSNQSQLMVSKKSQINKEPSVNVTICARCAKISNVGDNSSVSSASSVSTAKSSQRSTKISMSRPSLNTHRNGTSREPLAAKSGLVLGNEKSGLVLGTERSGLVLGSERSAKSGLVSGRTEKSGFSSRYESEDDEFESVSQISGQQVRIPRWQDSDDEDLTPRKGQSMLKRDRSPDFRSKTVTLREDVLKSLPQSTNTVENFLGKTWPTAAPGERKSHNKSADAKVVTYQQASTDKTKNRLTTSYDTFERNNNRGWQIARSDDGSL